MPTAFLQSPIGTLIITGDVNGISAISISDNKSENSTEIHSSLIQAHTELSEYFSNNRKHFTFKTNPQGTEFQKSVWRELVNIPFGTTTSYLELSKKLDNVKAIRAVASANGKNPLLIVIPCHRVIGKDGSLTGFSAGLWRKEWLLEHENPSQQQSLF